jgi:TRAP transporter TAXI family solute receptor
MEPDHSKKSRQTQHSSRKRPRQPTIKKDVTISKESRPRIWMAWSMGVMIAISVIGWYATMDRIPAQLKLVTGEDGGLYHQVGDLLGDIWNKHTESNLEIVSSTGSGENRSALMHHDVDLAILQGDAVSLDGFSIIAPLYPELVHVIVRKESDIHRVQDLKGHQILIGSPHSGMRSTAKEILSYHGLTDDTFQAHEMYFTELDQHPEIDAAIVTAGMMNPDLKKLLNTGDYRLIPIEYAEAIAMQNSFFIQMKIPKALYGFGTVPTDVDCITVATTSLLVGREDIGSAVVDELLNCVFQQSLWMHLPTLHSTDDILRDWSKLRYHPRAHQFFNPSDRVGHMANIMESLAAFKELAVALVAGLYLLWDRWKRIQEKDVERRMLLEKDKLDVLLTKTLNIERSQMESNSIPELRGMLDKVTRIKLQALDELTHEALRGDRIFLIFLTQCANLITKIQAKITQLNIEEAGFDHHAVPPASFKKRKPRRTNTNTSKNGISTPTSKKGTVEEC